MFLFKCGMHSSPPPAFGERYISMDDKNKYASVRQNWQSQHLVTKKCKIRISWTTHAKQRKARHIYWMFYMLG